MSDESISYREDKENLLYISQKINVDEFGLGEEGPFRESISSTASCLSVKPLGSEVNVLENVHSVPDIFSDIQVARRFKPFNLKWSFGINANVGLVNLTTDDRKLLFFSSAHSAILYQYCTREMKHLEGHQAVINCISSDATGDFLVSSDGDKDGCLIVWSSNDLNPIFTLFGIYPESGILLASISPCGRYLITIGANGSYQIDFWLWTLGEERSSDTFLVNRCNGRPIKICYHPDVEEQIMVVFEKQVFLIVWDQEKKKIVPSVTPHITNKNKIGVLTCGTYMKHCHESYVSSSKGCILVFRNTLYSRNFEEAELSNSKMYINAVKVSPNAIGCITTTEGILVVGDGRGHILFFDKNVKILFWIRNLSIGYITDIGFSITPKLYQFQNSKILLREKPLDNSDVILDCEKYEDQEEEITKLIDAPFDASVENKAFTVRDFFIATTDCNIYAYDFIRASCTPLFQVADANISCMDTHDEMPYLVVGYENGRLSLINFKKKIQIAEYLLPKDDSDGSRPAVTCIKFSRQSLHLVCGRVNGEVWVLEPVVLTPKEQTPFRFSRCAIVKIEFSFSGFQFAYYDSNRTVILFNYNVEQNCWQFKGKVRSHYETINDIRFFCTKDSGSSVLHTIGADRYLVEYNNHQVSDSDVEFGISTRERVEQSAVPSNFTYYEKNINGHDVGYILISNDKHKIKTIHASSKIPRTLVLGPAFGCFKDAHIKKMRVLPQHPHFMVFITERHIGIYTLPPDGNPYKHTGYLAHPNQVADFALSCDGLYAFTYGEADRCILQWEVKTRSVELLTYIGGTELEPYYCLLEGGKNGWLFQEIQDLFFYMQILQQENIDLPRRVSDCIRLTEIPDLVRTCGFYPSHFELETMMIDIRYRDYDESGILRNEISFVEFVKLFINHRPAYGYSLEQIRCNFSTICQMAEYARKNKIESDEFVYILQTFGEPSPNLHKYLTTLLRIQPEDESNFDFLPEDINSSFMLYELLGIDFERSETQVRNLNQKDRSQQENF